MEAWHWHQQWWASDILMQANIFFNVEIQQPWLCYKCFYIVSNRPPEILHHKQVIMEWLVFLRNMQKRVFFSIAFSTLWPLVEFFLSLSSYMFALQVLKKQQTSSSLLHLAPRASKLLSLGICFNVSLAYTLQILSCFVIVCVSVSGCMLYGFI